MLSMTATLAVIVASSVFLDPAQVSQVKESGAKAMQYLGSNFGMTMKDLQALSPKLAASMAEALGSESAGSPKRGSEDGPEPKEEKKKGEPKANPRKRKTEKEKDTK